MPSINDPIQALVAISAAKGSAAEEDAKKALRQAFSWKNEAAVAGTTAMAERVIAVAKQKCRLVALNLYAATATTANATNYLSVIVRKRTAALPGTQVQLCTLALDTPTTDDLAAFTAKNLLASPYQDGAAAAFDLEEGDVLTVEVTKTGGSGLAYPIAELAGTLEGRKA